MTRLTALGLVLRQDQNRELAATGRITTVDMRAHAELKSQARQEDIEQEWAFARTAAGGGPMNPLMLATVIVASIAAGLCFAKAWRAAHPDDADRDRQDLRRYRRALAAADAWFDDANEVDEATTVEKEHFLCGAAAYRVRIHQVLGGAR